MSRQHAAGSAVLTLIKTMRPAFLILGPVCVVLGYAGTVLAGIQVGYGMLGLILLAAVSAHISVNMLNEHHDFQSGLDLNTNKTPFSGGSGALPANPAQAARVQLLGWGFLVLTGLAGAAVMFLAGWMVWPLGVLGLLLVFSYTPRLNQHPWLCLVAPGLGFGAVVLGTFVVLTGAYAWQGWLLAWLVFCLVNNLLLLNQYPDVSADRQAGRRTFPIVYGFWASHLMYAVFAGLAFLSLVLAIVTGHLPVLAWWATLPFLGSVVALKGAIRWQGRIGEHPGFLAANVLAANSMPLLLALLIIAD